MAGDRPNVPNAMIVITDGQDDTDVESQHSLSLTKNIETYALGIGIGKHLAKFLNVLKNIGKKIEKRTITTEQSCRVNDSISQKLFLDVDEQQLAKVTGDPNRVLHIDNYAEVASALYGISCALSE